jgi:hypothetical protein
MDINRTPEGALYSKVIKTFKHHHTATNLWSSEFRYCVTALLVVIENYIELGKFLIERADK